MLWGTAHAAGTQCSLLKARPEPPLDRDGPGVRCDAHFSDCATGGEASTKQQEAGRGAVGGRAEDEGRGAAQTLADRIAKGVWTLGTHHGFLYWDWWDWSQPAGLRANDTYTGNNRLLRDRFGMCDDYVRLLKATFWAQGHRPLVQLSGRGPMTLPSPGPSIQPASVLRLAAAEHNSAPRQDTAPPHLRRAKVSRPRASTSASRRRTGRCRSTQATTSRALSRLQPWGTPAPARS